MNKIINLVIISLLTLGIAGCADNAATPAPVEEIAVTQIVAEEGEYASQPSGDTGGAAAAGIERLIIHSSSLSLEVPDTDAALDEINGLVDELGGWIVESNVYQYQEGLQAYVQLRVPAESLDTALERIRDMATDVRSESLSGQDVTEEYVDLQSRLRYLEATEKRLLEFLEEAEDTEAALAVYEQLQKIQSDVEQAKGRAQYLEQSAAMATINIDITPDKLAQPIQVGGWHPEGTLRNALESLINVTQFLVDALIVIIALVIPVLLMITAPIAGLFYLTRAILRRRRARKTKD